MPGVIESDLPLIAAPMAGGPTTIELARAAADAGAFPFLAGGYLSPEAFETLLAEGRDLGSPFGINLFVPAPRRDPGTPALDHAAFTRYARQLEPEAAAFDLELSTAPVSDNDFWNEKLALLLERPAPVVSFAFGLPSNSQITALQRAGSAVIATVTTPAEASAAHEAGVDALIVQAPAAGGHSATFDPARTITPISPAELMRAVRAAVPLPLIAAGGVDGPGAVQEHLRGGAAAVAIGTLLLRTHEAGTSPTHRAALADSRFSETVITRAFPGRPARALRNGFVRRHDADAPVGYPAVHHLTRPIRQAASAEGDADRLHLWAGTGWRRAEAVPAAQAIRTLIEAA